MALCANALLAFLVLACLCWAVLSMCDRLGRWSTAGDVESRAEMLAAVLVAAGGFLAMSFLAAWGAS